MPAPRGSSRRGRGRGRGEGKTPPGNSSKKNKRNGFSDNADAFFSEPDKRRRRFSDDVIDSEESGEEEVEDAGDRGGDREDTDGGGRKGEDDDDEETVTEKRLRRAKMELENIRALTRKMREEGEEDDDEGSDGDGGDEDHEHRTDALVADILQKQQLEKCGRAHRLIASRILKPEAVDEFRVFQRHRHPVTAVALNEDDSRGFSASKDGLIIHWDVESGAKDKYRWPNEQKIPNGDIKRQSRHVLALAVSSDGRYLATGGLDRLVHLWDIRTQEHLQSFKGHKAPVSCLTFRDGTSELFSGSFDNSIKWWNAADRTHLDNFFGHEAEVLTIDCLRKERVLTVGRDRTMRLFKVIDSVSLRFTAPSTALECCCFINNDDFLSGSDDGSVALWSMLRKKPLYIMKNAHLLPNNLPSKEGGILSNGVAKESMHQNSCSLVQSWVSSVAVCKGSDLAASGAGNGLVRLWSLESDPKCIKPLYDLPLVGFVNSLAFAKSGRFLLAGVGKEPRLGRWGRVADAQNGVALHQLKLAQ